MGAMEKAKGFHKMLRKLMRLEAGQKKAKKPSISRLQGWRSIDKGLGGGISTWINDPYLGCLGFLSSNSMFQGYVGDFLDPSLGGGFKYFLFSTLLGEMVEFDERIFQMGWFNHQLEVFLGDQKTSNWGLLLSTKKPKDLTPKSPGSLILLMEEIPHHLTCIKLCS